MKLQQISGKVLEKILSRAFQLASWDRTSLTKIHRRNDLQHIGTEYGGWVVPVDLIDAQSICYCVGCGEDISFDLGLIDKFNCHVFAFDPTPRAIDYVKNMTSKNSHYHFFDVGLWEKEDKLKFYAPKNPSHVSHSLLNLQKTENYIELKVKRLSHIMQENGHEKIDLLKLDIEGAEYKVIDSIIEDRIDIRIICVEFDECFNPIDNRYKIRVRSSVNNLLANGYRMVYSQGKGNYTFVRTTK